MGWRDRDYAKWTDEERRRFYGSGSATAGPDPHALGNSGAPRRAAPGGSLLRRGVGPAILVSAGLFTLGHVPAGNPLVPSLRFTLPGFSSASPASIPPTATIPMPAAVSVGSTLTLRGTAPTGNSPVTVEGSYDGGSTWQTLSTVESVNGSYAAEVTLTQRGPLQIQVVYSNGSKAVGSLVVN